MHDWIRWDSEVLDFVQIRWLELTNGFSCCVNLWLDTSELSLDVGFPLDYDLLVFCTSLLKLFNFRLSLSLLLHSYLDSLHRLVRLGLFNREEFLFLVGVCR